VPPLRVDHAAHRPKDLLNMRNGEPAMRQRPKFPFFMDAADRYPVGSPDWSGRVSALVWLEYERAEAIGFRPLVEKLQRAVPGRPWLAWPPDRPWGDADRWSRETVGLPWAKLLAIVREIDGPAAEQLEIIAAAELPERKIGAGEAGPGRGKKTADQISRLSYGTGSSYLAARLKRDRPDLAAEVEAGHKKLRTAAREAGIVKPRDQGRQLDKDWAATTPERRAAFVADHADELRRLLDGLRP
jgi:hypothetical protein